MKIKTGIVHVGMGAVALAFALISCSVFSTSVGETRTDTQTVELDLATSAKVDIDFSAGQLTVGSGAAGLMDASFRYNVDDWQPVVEYSESGESGNLRISQPGMDKFVAGETINEWAINLYNEVPLELSISTGAGVSDLNVSDLDLEALHVETGAGGTSIDLSGAWTRDIDVSISGGVGELTLLLPSEMGVEVGISSGIGNVNATGLTINGDTYVNSAFGSSAYTLRVTIDIGVGKVNLKVVE